MPPVMPTLTKERRKELVRQATALYKSGIMPTEPKEGTMTRTQRRQFDRAMGFRGTKAKRHNVPRNAAKVRQILLAEEALDAAKERIEHPLKARIKGF